MVVFFVRTPRKEKMGAFPVLKEGLQGMEGHNKKWVDGQRRRSSLPHLRRLLPALSCS